MAVNAKFRDNAQSLQIGNKPVVSNARGIANDKAFLPQFPEIDASEQFVRPLDFSDTSFYKVISIDEAVNIMATAALNAVFESLDIISDLYLAVSLFNEEAYANVSDSAKQAFVVLLFLGLLLSVGMSLVMTCTGTLGMTMFRSYSKDFNSTFKSKCSTFIMMFFGLPTHLVAFGRIVKVAGNNLVLMYDSRDDYKAMKKFTILSSHSWFLVFEDFPLFIINLYIATATQTYTFSAITALIFTGISLIVKIEYVGRFFREALRTGESQVKTGSIV